jgi:hypothetical protein
MRTRVKSKQTGEPLRIIGFSMQKSSYVTKPMVGDIYVEDEDGKDWYASIDELEFLDDSIEFKREEL